MIRSASSVFPCLVASIQAYCTLSMETRKAMNSSIASLSFREVG
jgi:hypothetical protein